MHTLSTVGLQLATDEGKVGHARPRIVPNRIEPTGRSESGWCPPFQQASSGRLDPSHRWSAVGAGAVRRRHPSRACDGQKPEARSPAPRLDRPRPHKPLEWLNC
ncbi:hypothetical protein CIHG_05385 [Coccidioides immitis H538.4]|uniref:Uncharacterized protein n=1 Tax=Coccidioides immitis H538.4 TaxID=396776 RepID=A0A0J8UL27_COCIT|nr:hypothetical protein CIHG_05385 [Coccidioides immitis H538.4]